MRECATKKNGALKKFIVICPKNIIVFNRVANATFWDNNLSRHSLQTSASWFKSTHERIRAGAGAIGRLSNNINSKNF